MSSAGAFHARHYRYSGIVEPALVLGFRHNAAGQGGDRVFAGSLRCLGVVAAFSVSVVSVDLGAGYWAKAGEADLAYSARSSASFPW
jgi:hypothetical protein